MKRNFVGQETLNGPKMTKRAEGGRNRCSSKKIMFWSFPLKRKRKEKPDPFGCLLGALFFSLVRYLFWAVLSCCVLENDFWNVKTSSLFCQGLSNSTELWRRPQHERRELLTLPWLIWLWSVLGKERGERKTHAQRNPNKSIPWGAAGPRGAGRGL